MASVFEIFGSIAIDKGDSDKVLDDLIGKAGELAKSVGQFAVELIGKSAETTNTIATFSKQFGMSATHAQELNYVLKQGGISLEQFNGSMVGFTSRMDKANQGNKTAVEMFGRLGVAVADSNGNLRNQGDVLWDTMVALQGIENQTERAALATEVFGSNGSTMMEVLSGEKGTIAELRQEAHDLNLIMSEELIEGGAAFTGTMEDLELSLAAAGTTIGAAFLPALNSLLTIVAEHSDEIMAGMQKVGNWIVENSDAIAAGLGTITVALIAGAIAAHPYATAIAAVVAGLAMLQTGGSRTKEKLFTYSDEELATLQEYVDAVNAAKEAEAAYFESEMSQYDVQKNKAWLDTAAKKKEAEAKVKEIDGLMPAYNNWLGTQGAEGAYLDVPLRPSEDSESTMQTEIEGYEFEGEADILASAQSETLIQAALKAMNLTAYVTLKPKLSGFSALLGGLLNIPGHATGLERVPKDNYIARLHKDEAVLTSSEAAIWRGEKQPRASAFNRRNTRDATDQPITVNLTVNGNSGSPYEIAGAVRDAMEMVRWGV